MLCVALFELPTWYLITKCDPTYICQSLCSLYTYLDGKRDFPRYSSTPYPNTCFVSYSSFPVINRSNPRVMSLLFFFLLSFKPAPFPPLQSSRTPVFLGRIDPEHGRSHTIDHPLSIALSLIGSHLLYITYLHSTTNPMSINTFTVGDIRGSGPTLDRGTLPSFGFPHPVQSCTYTLARD